MQTIRKNVTIPIYNIKVCFVICEDINNERDKNKDLLDDEPANYCGLVTYEGSKFGLFIEYEYLSHGIIAHEIYHLTRRICSYNNCDYDVNHHEHEALLCEYLTKKFYNIVNKENLHIYV
jgi:hypothetical protein